MTFIIGHEILFVEGADSRLISVVFPSFLIFEANNDAIIDRKRNGSFPLKTGRHVNEYGLWPVLFGVADLGLGLAYAVVYRRSLSSLDAPAVHRDSCIPLLSNPFTI